MKAYKCDECKECFEGGSFAVMKLEVEAVESDLPGAISIFQYDLCEKCYEKIKKARGREKNENQDKKYQRKIQ
jgi:hypothetical protein